ncbi:MAG: hypothetical protein ACRER2_02015 [Methylococcales bacterium]
MSSGVGLSAVLGSQYAANPATQKPDVRDELESARRTQNPVETVNLEATNLPL